MSFWHELQKPILGLSPMDGVTDLAYRMIQAKHGGPDVIFTEFIPVEGIVRLNENLLPDFWYAPIERPVIAQIYGNDPELYYASAQLVCELGFDGIDINMGCPARSVVHRGCGAALIATPDLANEIVLSTKRAVEDWVANGGINWDKWPVLTKEKAIRLFDKFVADSRKLGIYNEYEHAPGKLVSNGPIAKIPVTVKTRIGFREPVVEEWISSLLKVNPEVISIHGRTLKQLYAGQANWDEIAKAKHVRDNEGSGFESASGEKVKTLIFGNGDIKSAQNLVDLHQKYGLDGYLIGRGTFGNPWIFKQAREQGTSSENDQANELDLHTIFEVAKEHAWLQEKYKPDKAFVQVRKNLAWYVRGINGASALRAQLVRVNSAQEVADILDNYLLLNDSNTSSP